MSENPIKRNVDKGRATRALIRAGFSDGLSPSAIALGLNLTHEYVRDLAIEMGLIAKSGRHSPARHQEGRNVGEPLDDGEEVAFQSSTAAACNAHLADLKAAYPAPLASLNIPPSYAAPRFASFYGAPLTRSVAGEVAELGGLC